LDYYALPGTYLDTLLNGAANQVPVLTGNTKDESGATYGLNISLSTYLADLNSTYSGTWVEKFFEQYPANDSLTASGAYNSQFTDRSKVGTWFWAQLWKNASSKPVYNYIWDHAPPSQTQGAYHESEINYVLNNLYDTDDPWTSTDYEIASIMYVYWANCIKTGNPNGLGLATWTAATATSNQSVQQVGNGFGPVPIADPAKVNLFKEWFASLVAY
jgi:carboxylesterase 2